MQCFDPSISAWGILVSADRDPLSVLRSVDAVDDRSAGAEDLDRRQGYPVVGADVETDPVPDVVLDEDPAGAFHVEHPRGSLEFPVSGDDQLEFAGCGVGLFGP